MSTLAMDIWTTIALMLVIPAAVFLVTAAVVSAVRMSRREARRLLLTGLAVTPVALLCVWLIRQPWLREPWDTIVDVIAFGAGFFVYYAAITAVVRGGRWVVGKKNTRRRKIFVRCFLAAVAIAVLVAGWLVYEILYTLHGLPEAYAAWDTGSLVIEYMDTNEGEWPRSWDQLLTVVTPGSSEGVLLHGASAGDVKYARSLEQVVAVDWTADPEQLAQTELQEGELPFRVITRKDGSDFPVLWEGAEPNEMIWRYLRKRAQSDTPDQSATHE